MKTASPVQPGEVLRASFPEISDMAVAPVCQLPAHISNRNINLMRMMSRLSKSRLRPMLVALMLGCSFSHQPLPTAQGSDLRRSAIVRAVEEARDSVVNIHGQKTITASDDP